MLSTIIQPMYPAKRISPEELLKFATCHGVYPSFRHIYFFVYIKLYVIDLFLYNPYCIYSVPFQFCVFQVLFHYIEILLLTYSCC